MQQFRQTFHDIKRTYDNAINHDPELLCKQGYMGCPVLKLQKARWTNDSMRKIGNQTGIFFSIWLTDKGVSRNQVHYNIHALALRKLDGYRITSNDFTAAFRKPFAKLHHLWPNVSVDYGAQTLMEGWIQLKPKTLQRDVLVLMKRFGKLSAIIDDLLAQRLAPDRVATKKPR